MKITNEGVEYLIETPRYHYFRCAGTKLFPESAVFVAVFEGNSNIQDIRFQDWLGMMLHNKIVMSSDNLLNEEEVEVLNKVSPMSDSILVVNDTDSEYILKTLFKIVNTLLEDGSVLKSLELIK
tara:strand:+ start:222 stop:593 length:372 start_codon:yes stop_codon:yes gene_type:complete